MSDKIQKAREALYKLAYDKPVADARPLYDALDEAEANAKRVAELEQLVVRLERATTPGAALAPATPESKPAADWSCGAGCSSTWEAHEQGWDAGGPYVQCPEMSEQEAALRCKHGALKCGDCQHPPAPEAALTLLGSLDARGLRVELNACLEQRNEARAQLAAAAERAEKAEASAVYWEELTKDPKRLKAEVKEWRERWREQAALSQAASETGLRYLERAEKAERERDEVREHSKAFCECAIAARDAARRDLAEAVELLHEYEDTTRTADDLEDRNSAFLARLSAAQGDES